MVDSVQIWPPGFRITGTDGAPVSGAQVRFFEAGTTTPKNVYSDKELTQSLGSIVYTRSDGLPVASSGSTTTVTVYAGTAAYKFDVLLSDSSTLVPARDNVRGAIDTSTFLTAASVSTFSLPVVATALDLSVTTSHKGKLIAANGDGGNVTMTLASAVTLGDAYLVYITNAGVSGRVIIATSQSVKFAGSTFTKYALRPGETMGIGCDGAGFYVFDYVLPYMAPQGPAILTITDRVSASPGSPTAGNYYIVSAAFGSYAQGDVIISNGTDFNKITPPTDCGWLAWVQDEDRYYRFQANDWVLAAEPSASETVAGLIEVANATEMEAATDVLKAVVPGYQHKHPGHPKFWGIVTVSGGTPTLAASYNVAGITDTGTGLLGVLIDTNMSSAAYAVVVSSEKASTGSTSASDGRNAGVRNATLTAEIVTLECNDFNSALKDPASWHFVGLGDQ